MKEKGHSFMLTAETDTPRGTYVFASSLCLLPMELASV